MRIHAIGLSIGLLVTLGCSSKIINHRIATSADLSSANQGVPWVDLRSYDVYVYQGRGNPKQEGKLIYYGRHELLDKINGKVIDEGRSRWQTNYKADFFADGTLVLEFGELGNLKKAAVTTATGAVGAAKATGAVAGVPGEIVSQDVKRAENQAKILEAQKKIRDLERELASE